MTTGEAQSKKMPITVCLGCGESLDAYFNPYRAPAPWLLSCPAADDYGSRAQPRISAQVCGRGFQSRINPRGLTLTRRARVTASLRCAFSGETAPGRPRG